MRRYDPSEIEPKWVERWEAEGLYRASEDPGDPRPRFYALDMFSYPSGDLHMGHAEAFSGGDAVARFATLRGYNVLHPIGWDAFGLPAENAAIKRGIHPKEWTYANIDQQARSYRRLGMSFDWTRRLNTCDPEYYRWTQWFFLRLFERGLAYRKNAPTNWCPKDQTVLANEQVINGACERCGTPVVRRDLTQWFFKITDYAQRLLDDMEIARVARTRDHDAAQLDRAFGGRERDVRDRRDRRRRRGLHDPPRHAVGGHVLRVRARAPAGPQARRGRRGEARDRGGARDPADDPPDQPRGGGHPRGDPLGRPRGEPGERREDPRLRRAVRADGVRHRRRDGGAGPRPARLRVRPRPRPADPGGGPARGRARATRRR